MTMMSQLLKHGNIRTSCSSIARTEQSPRKKVKNKGQKDKEKTKPTNRQATSEQPGIAMAPYGTAGNSHGRAMTWPHQRPCFFADTISRLLNN
jgi:hypothetical protein